MVVAENTLLAKVIEAKNQKASFIQQVDQIHKKNQQQASTDPENKMLIEAGTKLSESLALLQKDLQAADSKPGKQRQHRSSICRHITEADLSLIIKKRESAPRFCRKKKNALKEAQNQLSSKQKDYSDFKQKVDHKNKSRHFFSSIYRPYPNNCPESSSSGFFSSGTLTFRFCWNKCKCEFIYHTMYFSIFVFLREWNLMGKRI